MNRQIKIAPSLLSCDFGRIREEIQKIEASDASLLHLDVMDGHFVPNLTFGPPIIKYIKKYAKLPLDVHLMVTNPGDYIEPLADIGVDYLSFHTETVYHANRLVNHIKERGMKAGVVLNPSTHPMNIEYLSDIIDFVLVMSVNPGFGGQSFIPSSLTKIKEIALFRKTNKLSFEIEVDGGVNDQNSPILIEAGSDILVAGSYIFNSDNYAEKVRSLINV
ncbi:MAG: ribulose-phosphate 3-epimerase [Candidatus Cloacimonadales bacterium]|jgi:ribulose-phosphate 3-epimerase|nr:ribulose-phosphate 3-epimerase [Candidatus Cloacimonadota bacterium]MDD2651388.1 ribulose-phosphate 3-epimerase [Candidatus Cloacimonadota bacterium]MDD3500910.1 ribulose-phosphate 3-epimerase [Candidatus Cloacimonadota bacterium]MDX9976990.1 ribulose-phosphate 3-epimerase [Candidatus Cloacimonadales bacterium]